MAGLKSAYVLKKWRAIQSNAEGPLRSILKGDYTQGDVDVLGSTLRKYDDLAYSVFAEGVRTSELSAKARIAKIQKDRQAKGKTPFDAKQMAVIYKQAVDHAQQETMPSLLDAITELLDSKNINLEDIVKKPEEQPLGLDQPKLKDDASKPRMVEKAQELPAANENFSESLVSKLVKHDKESWKDKLEQIKELIGLGGKAKTEEEKEEKLFESLSKKVSELTHNKEENTYTGVVVGESTKVAETIVADSMKEFQEKFIKFQKDDKEKFESAKDNYNKGLFSRMFGSTKERKKKKEDKERDKIVNQNKQGKLGKASRLVRNTGKEAKDVMKYLGKKYNGLSGLKNKISSGDTIALLAMGIIAAVGAITAFIKKYKDVDILDMIKTFFVKIKDWAMDKVLDMLGIKKDQPQTDFEKKQIQDANYTTSDHIYHAAKKGWDAVTQNSDEKRARDEELKKDPNFANRKAEVQRYADTHTFTPDEALAFKKENSVYAVKIPSKNIKKVGTSMFARTPSANSPGMENYDKASDSFVTPSAHGMNTYNEASDSFYKDDATVPNTTVSKPRELVPPKAETPVAPTTNAIAAAQKQADTKAETPMPASMPVSSSIPATTAPSTVAKAPEAKAVPAQGVVANPAPKQEASPQAAQGKPQGGAGANVSLATVSNQSQVNEIGSISNFIFGTKR